jgi:hypothetical protein
MRSWRRLPARGQGISQLRVPTVWGLVLLMLATGFGTAAATQGCDDCRELKKEYRDGALARYTPAAASPTATPSVRMILYWSKGCGHCEAVLDGVLPGLQEKYGAQLEVRLVEVVSMEDISAFFDVAEGYGYTRGRAAVPFLLIGERALLGVDQISGELPGLIDTYFTTGGVDWPKPKAREATAQLTAPAGAGCTVGTPCADDAAIASSLSPAAEKSATGIPVGVILGLIGILGASGAVMLSRLVARRRLCHPSVTGPGQESGNGGEL